MYGPAQEISVLLATRASKAHLGSLARAFAESMDKHKCSGLGVMVVHSLLLLSKRWPCHIWLVDRKKFASLVAKGGWLEPFSLSHSSYLSPSLWEEFQHD